MKPFYQKNNITIYCGDCAEVMKSFAPNAFDLTVTSPPYDNLRDYNGYTFDFDPISKQLWRITSPGGIVVWVVGDQTINGSETGTSFRQALGFMGLGFNLHDTMIYEAAGTGAKGSHLSYWQSFEFMFILSNGRPKTVNRIADRKNKMPGFKKWPSPKNEEIGSRINRVTQTAEIGIRANIWRYAVGWLDKSDKTSHPAPFPEALVRDHILSWSNPGDLVLDPMMGSGTTLKMAMLLDRRAIGIDESEEYCKIAVERLRQPTFFSLPGVEVEEAGMVQGELFTGLKG